MRGADALKLWIPLLALLAACTAAPAAPDASPPVPATGALRVGVPPGSNGQFTVDGSGETITGSITITGRATWTPAPVPTVIPAGTTPTPPATSRPATTVTPAPVPPPATVRLQQLVDAAPSGGTVNVPPGLYREAVTINKPLTLNGGGAAEIRGSDLWSTGWSSSGSRWAHAGAPSFPALSDPCIAGVDCNYRQMVFYDGHALKHVQTAPGPGQFSVEGGNVNIGDNPNGHQVEVVTRASLIRVAASDVTVDGFTLRHVSNGSGSSDAGVFSSGNNNVTFQHNRIYEARSALFGFQHGDNFKLLNNDLGWSGGSAGGTSNSSHVLMQGNTMHDVDSAGFQLGWSGGASKSAVVDTFTFDGNELWNADGPGFWCDISCHNVTVSNNRIHDVGQSGIFYEISDSAKILNNVVWNTGWDFNVWCFGGGITLSSSTASEVAGNTLAWNAQGITVLSQNRENGYNVVKDVKVHDNTVVMKSTPSQALAWCQDFAAGTINNQASNNTGAHGLYWFPGAENGQQRFGYNGHGVSTLAEMNNGWGEEGARYLTNQEKDSILAAKGVPTSAP